MQRRRLGQRAINIDDGFFGKADPNYLEAINAEIQDQIDFMEGRIAEKVIPPEPHALTHAEWPTRSYGMVYRWRHRMLARFAQDPTLAESMYANQPVKFICQWCDIYEPRNAGKGLPTRFPFVLFKRQEELLQFFHGCVIDEGNGIVEKSRDMGATWCGVAYSIWMWRFVPGSAIGWGSADSDKLDRLGEPGSIFEKIRLCIRGLPPVFKPKKLNEKNHLLHKRIVNPDNGNTITGDIGDNIGRGGRTRLYVVDEAAYLEHPDAVEGALSENTRVRIDISSVSGPGTVFHRTRQAGVEWSPGKPIETSRYNVFLLDWRDHPDKNPEWAAKRKESFESRGLGHVYAREIERNYAAVTEGAIIKPEWVDAAFDANKKLKLVMDDGPNVAGLDVADGGEAANGFTLRRAQTIKRLKIWQSRDTAITAREAIIMCNEFLPCELQYDCIGLGSGIKAEVNRLKDEGLISPDLVIIPWNAGAPVLKPLERVILKDDKSPLNRDFYSNLKAQGWWVVRQLFYNTFRAVKFDEKFDVKQLICIDTSEIDVTMLHKLRDELCQVQSTNASAKMKLSIKKADHDRQSPNLADSAIEAMWPMPERADVPTGVLSGFVAPIVINV